MRLLFLMVPIALVGGYTIHELRSTPQEAGHVETAPQVPPVPAAPQAPQAPTGILTTSVPASPSEITLSIPVAAAIDLELDEAGTELRGAVHASVDASLAAILEVVTRASRDQAGDAEELSMEILSLASTVLADIAARLDGYIELETADGRTVLVTLPQPEHRPR